MMWTDNPVMDAENYFADDPKVKKCEDCGEPIRDDYYIIFGHTLCRNCVDDCLQAYEEVI